MLQLSIEQIPEKITSCAFTGHRELKRDFSQEKLSEVIDECIRRGCKNFYCGMAKGFDLKAGEEIIKRIKNGQDLKLFACIPYQNQPSAYSEQEKKRYDEILSLCEKKIVFYQTYTKWCMSERNEYMADHADVLIAYLNADKGGTYNTVKYFLKKKKGYVFYL